MTDEEIEQLIEQTEYAAKLHSNCFWATFLTDSAKALRQLLAECKERRLADELGDMLS